MSERPARRGFASRPADPDQWIRAAGASPRNDSATGYTARLTIDVTPDQRGRIKIAAFQRGITVADIAAQPTPEARTDLLTRYIHEVWARWAPLHQTTIAAWFEQYVGVC